jgi:hypothetical protein
MATQPKSSAQHSPFSSKGRGGIPATPQSDPPSASPPANQEHPPRPGFLNRTFSGKPVRHSYACRGRKGRKSGGTYQSLYGNHNRNSPKNFRGPYTAQRYLIAPALVKLKREPLNEHAKELLASFLQREAFWRAIEEDMIPVGFAGETFLGVKKRRAEQILNELEEAGSPLDWLLVKAVEGFKSGKIARGRATLECQLANRFFLLLAGDETGVAALLAREFGGTEVGHVGVKYTSLDDFEQEIVEYFICSKISNKD